MPSYKGYNPMGPGDVKPWGQGDLDHEKNVIDSLVMDCVSQTKDLTGHKHKSLYDPSGVKIINPTNTLITIGDDAHDIDIRFRQSWSSFRIREPGTTYDVISAWDVNGNPSANQLMLRCPKTDTTKALRFYADTGIFTTQPTDVVFEGVNNFQSGHYAKWWRIGRMIFVQLNVQADRTQDYVRMKNLPVCDGVGGVATAKPLGGVLFLEYNIGGSIYQHRGGAFYYYDEINTYISFEPTQYSTGWPDSGTTTRYIQGVLTYLCRNDQ